MLAEVALAAGFDVKKAEVHGMAQRGGSVNSHVRWDAERVYSPLIGLGEADMLLVFEEAEALRYAEFLKPGAWPSSTNTPSSPSPSPRAAPTIRPRRNWRQSMAGSPTTPHGARNDHRPGLGQCPGSQRGAAGRASTFLDVPAETWLEVIEARVPPKYVELNRQAFLKGREAVEERGS